MDTVIKGTELKYKLDIECTGFSMADDNFLVELYNSRVRQEIHKDSMDKEGDNWYFTFSSEDFGTGEVTLKVTAYVPDSAFEDGLRTEVQKQQLCKVIS